MIILLLKLISSDANNPPIFFEFYVTRSKSYVLWRDSSSLTKSETITETLVETPTLALLRFLSSVDAIETILTSAKFLNPTTCVKLLTGSFQVSYWIGLLKEYEKFW